MLTEEMKENLVATGLRGIKKAKVRYRFKSKKTRPDTIDYRPIFNEAGYYPPDQGNQGCYSADTQILTSDGWKCFPEVTDKETLATLNMDGEIEYHPPTNYFEYDYEGDMYHCSKKGLDFLVTPNHNIYCKKWDGSKRTLSDKPSFVRADQLGWYSGLLRTGKWKGKDQECFIIDEKQIPIDDWLWFLGIYVAEGCATPYKKPYTYQSRIEIAAVNPKKREIIEKQLKKLPWHVGTLKDRFRIYNRELYNYVHELGQSKTKTVPEFIKKLPPYRIEKFLEGFIVGDGCTVPVRNNNKQEICLYTSSPKLADDLQELLLKIGKCGNIRERKPRLAYIRDHWCKGSTNYEIWIKNRVGACIERRENNIKIEKYKGKVYCFEVPNHTLYVRIKGTPLWLGNSCTSQCGINDKAFQEIVNKTFKEKFSAAMLYWDIRDIDGVTDSDAGGWMDQIGGVLGGIMKGVKVRDKLGVCHNSTMPYSQFNYKTQPPSDAYVEAKNYECNQ